MSLVINSNMTASMSALNLSRSNDLLRKSMLRLSSGKRIVNPADDAGGLAVGLKLQSALRRTAATKHNIQNGVSYLQVQDGALKVVGSVLDRMAELKSYSNDVTKNEQDRQNYNYEFKELQAQLVELRRSKFNGVSLFSTTENDPELIRIITTEDGLTGKVDLNRKGLFENLKSKYGADGELNSGSHGSYRQLVGDFVRDGGKNDPMMGKASRDYKNGAVVYMDGPTDDKKGYFMALKDVRAGSFIEDTYGAGSDWIRIADGKGNGFAESFPESPMYDPFSLKKSATGGDMSYLKGDVVQVPAHWAGGTFYLEAQQDVPYGMTLAELFDNNHVGEGQYFDYVGQDLSDDDKDKDGNAQKGRKPTTNYVRANSNLADPEEVDPADLQTLVDLMKANSNNDFTPGYVRVAKAGVAAGGATAGGGTTAAGGGAAAGTKQVDTISNLFGDVQTKIVQLNNIVGDENDAFEVTITDKEGLAHKISAQWADGTAATSANTAAAIVAQISAWQNSLVDSTGSALPPWLQATVNGNDVDIEGLDYAGDFQVTAVSRDNNGTDPAAVNASLTVEDSGPNARAYKADQYTIEVDGKSVTVDFVKDSATTLQAIADKINDDASLSAIVDAAVSGNNITLTAVQNDTAFTASVTPTDVFKDEEPNAGILTPNPSEKTTAASVILNHTTRLPATTSAPTTPTTPTTPSASGPYDVYQPAQNWGLEKWKSDYPFKAGQIVFQENGAGSKIVELSDKVKGQWFGSTPVETGDFMLGADQKWYQSLTSNSAEPTATDTTNWKAVSDPLLESDFGTDKTSEFQDPTAENSKYWVKTHFGHLVKNAGDDGSATGTETIKTNYERGDNIYYNGKHYIYVSNLPSNDPSFLSPKGDGYTELEDLISRGAVRETSLYVDTRGGGGSADLPAGVYYRPNQALEHIDRLPDSGLVRSNSITRRTDAMTVPGDEIFNSADDLFHGGLDAGSDGIYGTADDFYASTTDQSVAKAGFHVDGDADNNKDLLDSKNDLNDFSVADFVDYIQSLANFRAINGGTMSRLGYSQQMLEENQINLEAAVSRVMDADMAEEASKLARQNVLVQAGASMLVQSNQLTNVVLSLLQ